MNIEEAAEILKELAHDMLQDYIYDKSEITEYDKKINLAIETLLIAYEKEKEEKERIGKLYYETNESCVKYEKSIIKIEEILEKYKYTEIGNSEKIIEFYKELKSILSKEE